ATAAAITTAAAVAAATAAAIATATAAAVAAAATTAAIATATAAAITAAAAKTTTTAEFRRSRFGITAAAPPLVFAAVVKIVVVRFVVEAHSTFPAKPQTTVHGVRALRRPHVTAISSMFGGRYFRRTLRIFAPRRSNYRPFTTRLCVREFLAARVIRLVYAGFIHAR